MKLSDLYFYLSEVPIENRSATGAEMMGISEDTLTVYHITEARNAESIRKLGLTAKSSAQSYDRPKAVYFFCEREEANASAAEILIGGENHTIITITIPIEKIIENAVWDGLYNAGFGVTRSAVQYLDSIPSQWIL